LIIEPALRKRLIRQLKSLGYNYITLDLEGYRPGSLNLRLKKKTPAD
jgi:PP-loop superfamily ATP-utilizing enzyme